MMLDNMIDSFINTVAITNFVVSNSYYGMLRGFSLPPERPKMFFKQIEIQNGCCIGKRSTCIFLTWTSRCQHGNGIFLP